MMDMTKDPREMRKQIDDSIRARSYATGIHIATLHRRYHSGVRGEDFIKPCKPVLPTNRRWANRLTSPSAQPNH